jgi:membrane-bound serine protease (ClpP class)
MLRCILFLLLGWMGFGQLFAQTYQRIYRLPIKQEIAQPVRKIVLDGLEEAKEWNADLILIEMDTYGGAVDAADDIRTALLNSAIPVWVYIENNAASAGAFISIACTQIYMKPGATIGAATVVGSDGEKVDEKYQSFMRAKMRETALQRGRNPSIAEAMVDGTIVVPGVNDSGKVVSLTSSEALNLGFSDGTYSSLQELLRDKGLEKSEQKEFETGGARSLVLFFLRPEVSGILLSVILLGIFFELQSPGVGLPGLAALIAALLFFIPNYLEGMAMYWEILLFLAGLLLLGLEIFVIPGFGIAGIAGALLMLLSLILSITANLPAEPGWGISAPDPNGLIRSMWVVVLALLGSLGFALLALKTLPKSNFFRRVAVLSELKSREGFRSSQPLDSSLNERKGIAMSPLRPGGMVDLDGKEWEARSVSGWIERGQAIQVVQQENNILLVKPAAAVKSDT